MVELAKALGRVPSVLRVDLLTRLVADPAVSPDYSVQEEPLLIGGGSGSSSGAFIVRLPCGDPNVYLR